MPAGIIGDYFLILGVMCAGMRSRTDQRHIAGQHVEQLWKLVNIRTTQHATYSGNPRVVFGCLTNNWAVLQNGHRSKLPYSELSAIEAIARLHKKSWTMAIRFD